MKSVGWIDFRYKLPFVNVNGGAAPYDYLIIIAIRNDMNIDKLDILGIPYRNGGMYLYSILYASEATEFYQQNTICHDLFVAWTAFDGCTVTL